MLLLTAIANAQTSSSAYSVTSSRPDMNGFYTWNNQTFNGKPVFKHVTKDFFLYYGSYAGLRMEWQIGERVADWSAPWSCCYYFSNQQITGAYMDVSMMDAFAEVQEQSLLATRLEEFQCSAVSNHARLQWRIRDEATGTTYTIERSEDGQAFQLIAQITASGTSGAVKEYSFTDPHTLGTAAYYRIRITENTGKLFYSLIRKLSTAGSHVQTWPNPAIDRLFIRSDNAFTARVFNANGARVQLMQSASPQNSMNIANLPAGVYAVQITTGDGRVETTRFIKNVR